MLPAMDSLPLPKLPLDKSGAAIRDMFAGVAPRYDLLNHLLSGALDFVWRRRAAAALRAVRSPARILDLCCGTGDQATADAANAAGGAGGIRVAAADFCVPMLAIARRKFSRTAPNTRPRPQALAADALALPFPDRAFGGATVSFGLRNVADLGAALRQLARVLQPGGRLVVLECALPRRQPLRGLYLFYFTRLLPGIGRLLSPRGSAYSYLPESVLQFPQRQAFLNCMEKAGFSELAWEDLAAGAVCLYQGVVRDERDPDKLVPDKVAA
jgi:demethylmenaquinone methyltransferase/2-methoxy-6-polyprenyl-1,4-benzoquinol methylase